MGSRIRTGMLAAILAAVVVGPTWAASQPGAESCQRRPAWLGEASVELSVSYDDNVYFQKLGSLANRSALVLSVQPSLTFQILHPSEAGAGSRLALVYAPEILRYDSWSEQDHVDHQILLSWGGERPQRTWEVVNELRLTDGRGTAQDWPSPLGLPRSPVIGGPEFRSRTRNREIRGRASLRRYLGNGWFVRPRAEWWASDFRTEQRETSIPNSANTFYGNYVDRGSIHAGLDLGRRLASRTYLTLGYRLGIQDQGRLVGSPYQYDNRFQLLLVGIEGAPSERLSYSVLAGPDFRAYGSAIRPGEDPHPVEIYADGRLQWAVAEGASVQGRLRLFKFMPGGGQGAMAMTLADLSLRRQIAPAVSLQGGVRVFGGAIEKPDPRGTDWLFTGWVRASWRQSERRELALEVVFDRGVSEEKDFYETPIGVIPGPNGSGREYTRRIVSLSLKLVL